MQDYNVLIIDDDQDAAAFFSRVLSLLGFNCKVVHSGREAFAHLSMYQPDMVLLDMLLGKEISGEDILFQIRTNPRFEKTRVIITTAYPDMAQPITDLADLTLFKPIALEQLQTFAARLAAGQPTSRQFLFRDPATRLYTREFFLNRLEHAIERSRRRTDFFFAVLAFTIQIEAADDDPAFLDGMIFQLTRLLVAAFRPTDTFARLNNQDFASLHEELKQPADLDVLVQRLQQTITQPVLVSDRSVLPQAYVGAVFCEPCYTNALEMLTTAESALARNKLHPDR